MTDPTSKSETTDLSGSFPDPPAPRRELAALERRVEMLERAMLAQPMAPAPTYPAPPVYHSNAGCTCPAGAEAGCQGPGCPRRRWGGPT